MGRPLNSSNDARPKKSGDGDATNCTAEVVEASPLKSIVRSICDTPWLALEAAGRSAMPPGERKNLTVQEPKK